MSSLSLKLRTVVALGFLNIFRVVFYRLGVKLSLNPVRILRANTPRAPFFIIATKNSGVALKGSVTTWHNFAQLFSYWPLPVSESAPDWLANPLSGKRVAGPDRSWWEIPDFDPAVGDIKLIWELSRMDWVLAFAQQARLGDATALVRLNFWLSDWCSQNTPYKGPNWKCGQEASIRVMHLAMAALILGQVRQPTSGLLDLIKLHLQRIAPTVQYAMAQDNNHGTSEAAALFIGGSWLASQGVREGDHWENIGRRWLENRAARLIGKDGSFSQYSVNYHRVMLDTFCMAEIWRTQFSLPAFSARLQERTRAAAEWLYNLVSPSNGDAPNLGANDGARLLQLTDTLYRDHRPSVQLAMALFAGKRAYSEDGPWNTALQWLEVPLPSLAAPAPCTRISDDGGFAVLWRGSAMAMLRYPRFRFRPGQADALHVDLWLGGKNLLRDAGTYSYNTEKKWLDYFGGTESHNTVQFDERDQMPRLSRFLFGDWLKTSFKAPLVEDLEGVRFGAGYQDRKGARHIRRIHLTDANLRITDEVSGFGCKAVLRWRLGPGEWRLSGLSLTDGVHVITVQASMPVVRCELVEGWESRHYLEKTPVPVMEIEVHQPGIFTTDYHWAA